MRVFTFFICVYYFCCSLFLLHRQEEWKQHHNGDNSHKLQKKIQQSLTPGIIEPEICRLGLIPTDNGCIVGGTGDIGSWADSGKQRVSHVKFLWEGNIDVIGTFKGSLNMVITNGCGERYNIIPLLKCYGLDIT